MKPTLEQEYATLTEQLKEVTRRRNEVGETLVRQKAETARYANRQEDKVVLKALVELAKSGDWATQAAALGVADWRLTELFHNALRRVRAAYPEQRATIPTRVGPKTLATWSKWSKYVKAYIATL